MLLKYKIFDAVNYSYKNDSDGKILSDINDICLELSDSGFYFVVTSETSSPISSPIINKFGKSFSSRYFVIKISVSKVHMKEISATKDEVDYATIKDVFSRLKEYMCVLARKDDWEVNCKHYFGNDEKKDIYDMISKNENLPNYIILQFRKKIQD